MRQNWRKNNLADVLCNVREEIFFLEEAEEGMDADVDMDVFESRAKVEAKLDLVKVMFGIAYVFREKNKNICPFDCLVPSICKKYELHDVSIDEKYAAGEFDDDRNDTISSKILAFKAAIFCRDYEKNIDFISEKAKEICNESNAYDYNDFLKYFKEYASNPDSLLVADIKHYAGYCD